MRLISPASIGTKSILRIGLGLILGLAMLSGAGYGQETERKAPYSVILADLDGDGYPDMISTNYVSNTVTIRLNDGTGGFPDAVDMAVGVSPTGVVAVDVDGDGILDLVVANAYSNDISVLLGLGDGTFAEANNFDGGSLALSIVADDFNGDGYMDIATGDYAGTVTLLLGRGDGTFEVPDIHPMAGRVVCLSTADVNGDGIPDFIATVEDPNVISFLLSDAQNGYQRRVDYPTFGRYPQSHVVADFNGDLTLDIAVADTGAQVISVMMGRMLYNGDTILQDPVLLRAGQSPLAMAVGDFNGDGKLDIAAVSAGDNKLSIWLGNGRGGFQPSITVNTQAYPRAIAVGDVDNDGNLDLVIANEYANSLSLIRGVGEGRFDAESAAILK